MKSSFYIALLASMFAKTMAGAQTGLSLEQALSEGLSSNPQLKSSEAAVYEARAKKREVFGGFLPRIDLVSSHFFDLKYQQIQISPTSIFESIYPKTSYGAQASLNLFDGLKTTYSYSAGKYNAEAADFELEHAKMSDVVGIGPVL